MLFKALSLSQQAALVLNASRRFRYTLDLKKEEEKDKIRRKIRAHAQVIRVCFKSTYHLLYQFQQIQFQFMQYNRVHPN